MTTFLETLKNRVLLFDGAMGTFLQKRGLEQDACPEEWNVLHPDIIKEIHKSYYDAGSDCVETNSFGGSKIKLDQYRLGDRTYEFNKLAAELARDVCPQGKFVAGSVGPSGQMLEPYGTLSPKEAYEGFAEQMRGLKDGGVDVICIETMMDMEESKIAIKSAKEITGLPVISTMTFSKGPSGYKTLMGNSIKEIAKNLTEAGADVIGSNCGTGLDDMIKILEEIKSSVSNCYLMIQPNAGLPELVGDKSVYKETPEVMKSKLPELLKIGLNIIGGCCGTTPDHIKAFKEILINYKILF